MKNLVIFASGCDVPGVGSSITKILFDNECNITNFKMTTMDGFFSFILSTSCYGDINISRLEAQILDAVKSYEVNINIIDALPISKNLLRQKYEEWIPYKVLIECDNRAGLLYYFMRDMGLKEINIIDIRCTPIEINNKIDYRVVALIEVPLLIDYDTLYEMLIGMAHELKVTVDIQAINDLEI